MLDIIAQGFLLALATSVAVSLMLLAAIMRLSTNLSQARLADEARLLAAHGMAPEPSSTRTSGGIS